MAEPHNLSGLETQSVSTLGLRWAALRGMLGSPLIAIEDQRSLRDELLRELGTLEQGFSTLQSRNPVEISAKIDIAKSALQERGQTEQSWLIDLLESIQADLQTISPRAAPGPAGRPITNLTRNHHQRVDENASEVATPSAA